MISERVLQVSINASIDSGCNSPITAVKYAAVHQWITSTNSRSPQSILHIFSLHHILEASQAVTQVPHLQFSAHAVGPRHQDRVNEAGSLQVKQPCETSEFCVTA